MAYKLGVGLLYISLHNLLKKRHGINRTISRKELFCELGKHFLIPKNLKEIIIIELIQMKLLQKVDRNNLELLECEFDLETDANKLYQLAGLF